MRGLLPAVAYGIGGGGTTVERLPYSRDLRRGVTPLSGRLQGEALSLKYKMISITSTRHARCVAVSPGNNITRSPWARSPAYRRTRGWAARQFSSTS